jgi:small-conductance mechanosensitive channel
MTIEEFFQSLWVWFTGFVEQLVPKYVLPNVQMIIQVVILLFVAYIAGRISKAVVIRILRVFGLRKASVRGWTDDILRAVGYKGTIVGLIGDLVKWFIYIIFFGIIIETLGFPSLVIVFNQIAGFVPRFIISILVIVMGFLVADFVGKVFEEASRRLLKEEMISIFTGGLIKYSIALVSIIMSLSLLGLDTISLMILLGIVVATSMVILIMGIKDVIPNFSAGIQLKSVLRPGQHVTVNGISGTVEKINPLSVILKTRDKRISVPNSEFVKNPVEWKVREKK